MREDMSFMLNTHGNYEIRDGWVDFSLSIGEIFEHRRFERIRGPLPLMPVVILRGTKRYPFEGGSIIWVDGDECTSYNPERSAPVQLDQRTRQLLDVANDQSLWDAMISAGGHTSWWRIAAAAIIGAIIGFAITYSYYSAQPQTAQIAQILLTVIHP